MLRIHMSTREQPGSVGTPLTFATLQDQCSYIQTCCLLRVPQPTLALEVAIEEIGGRQKAYLCLSKKCLQTLSTPLVDADQQG